MAIPTHKTWLEETSRNILRPRSPQLKMVDNAILEYERVKTPAAMGKIKLAFEAWKRAKGNWQQNERNRTGALTRLDWDLQKVQAVRFTPQELQALAYIAEQRKNVIRNLFEGKQVVLKGPKSAKQALTGAVEELKGAGRDAADWLQKARKSTPLGAAKMVQEKLEEMARSFFGVETLASLGDLTGFVLGIVSQASVSVAPVVGHIKDGYDLIVGWGKAGLAFREEHDIASRSYTIDVGAPAAAFAGLKSCLSKETATQVGEASIATTSFTLKTGLALLDGGAASGPAVGAVKALAQVSLKLLNLGMEWRATRKTNQVLANGPLDLRLFKTYPLMGCYLLTSATLSDVIPIDCFGKPGWMDYIEDLKKRGYDGIYQSATNLLESSPWEIPGLPKRPIKGGALGLGGTMAPGLAGDLLNDVFTF